MSKVLAAIVATTGAATASVGGVYILKSGVGTVGSPESKSPTEPQEKDAPSATTLNADLTFKDLTTFESGKGGSCVSHVFGDLEFTNKGTLISNGNQIDGVDFSSKTSEEVKSCLVVNWEKTSYSDASGSTDKWKGYFRGVWSFSVGDKGFVMFVTTKENSLELDGGFYYLEKTQEQTNKWSISKHKQVESSKVITKEQFSSIFSTAGTKISDSFTGDSKSNWGFVAGQDDIQYFCSGDGSCGNGTAKTSSIKPFKESWLWQKGESSDGKIIDGMGNYATGFPAVFSGGDLKLDGFTGSGSKSIPTS